LLSFVAQAGEAVAQRGRTLVDLPMTRRAYFQACLLLQHAHEVGVIHWCQRMIFHPRFAEQHVTDKKIALKDSAAASVRLGPAFLETSQAGTKIFQR
jgi:hypothetical protein